VLDQHEPDALDHAVHKAIRLKRESYGMSRRELGRRASLSEGYVSALEAGNLNPSFAAFSRLAHVLRLTPTEIFFLVQTEASRGD
jgi:transcriptional regulator with XRE-family HTH domain